MVLAKIIEVNYAKMLNVMTDDQTSFIHNICNCIIFYVQVLEDELIQGR